jgi:hypothetical protein
VILVHGGSGEFAVTDHTGAAQEFAERPLGSALP